LYGPAYTAASSGGGGELQADNKAPASAAPQADLLASLTTSHLILCSGATADCDENLMAITVAAIDFAKFSNRINRPND